MPIFNKPIKNESFFVYHWTPESMPYYYSFSKLGMVVFDVNDATVRHCKDLGGSKCIDKETFSEIWFFWLVELYGEDVLESHWENHFVIFP